MADVTDTPGLSLTWAFDEPFYLGPQVIPPPPANAGPYQMFTPFDFPYYTSAGIARPTIPPLYPFNISIGGRTYIVDTSFEPYRREAFRHRSIQAQKANITVDNIPGEGTVDSQGLWRRLAQDWSLGSGQLYFDRRESVDNRFRESKGVNVWTQWEATLLDDTKLVRSSVNSVVEPLMAGNTLYVLDGTNVFYSTDLVTFTQLVTGLPLDITDLATNGTDLWFASPTKGLVHSTVGASTATPMGTPPMTYVAWAGDRLMSSNGPKLYNILSNTLPVVAVLTTALTVSTAVTSLDVSTLGTQAPINLGDQIVVITGGQIQTFIASADVAVGSGAIPVTSQVANGNYPIGSNVGDVNPIYTAPQTNWIWNNFAYGSSQIYIGGYVNSAIPSQGAVYRTTIDSNGIDLTVPVIALPLEGGEYPTALGSYLNLVFVGTNLGLRLCQTLAAYDPTGNQGDLRSGPLLPTIIEPVTQPVTGIVGNGRFVYWTWNDYDTNSTGLGRCDLSHFIDNLAPAYASDLMVPGQGLIALDWQTIINGTDPTIKGSPIMGIPGSGLWVSANTYVASGHLDSGFITYGIPDDKIAMDLSYRTNGDGNITGQISVETGGFGVYGTTNPGQAVTEWPLPELTGEYFEIRTMLFPDQEGMSPIVARWLLESIAAVTAGVEISVVILTFSTGQERGIEIPYNDYDEYLYLETLRRTQNPVYYVEGPFSALCVIDQIDRIPHKADDQSIDRGFFGDMVVYLKTVGPANVSHLPSYTTTT